VSLGTHPRYRADYKAMACGQVAAARAAMGATPAEFAVWLDSVLDWQQYGGAIERWEAGAKPPADVVLACQAYLAGQQARGSLKEAPKPRAGT
jgi:hypothetical protein